MRQESEIIALFNELRPSLLAYIFDILAKVLQIKPSIKLQELPRMADFTVWGEAIAQALGYKKLEFVNCYFDNIGKQNIEAIEDNPISRAIANCLDKLEEESKPPVIEGQPLEVLEVYSEQKGGKPIGKRWPTTAHVFTRRLKQIQSNLSEGLGIEILITRNTKSGKKANTSLLKIWKNAPLYPENSSNTSNAPILQYVSVEKGENEGKIGSIVETDKTQIAPIFKNTSNADDGINNKEIILENGRIENGFTNENQLNAHSLEESPFKQLIRRSGPNNVYYQCILHPKIERIHLEEIVRHCLFKREEHEAELQRISKQESKEAIGKE